MARFDQTLLIASVSAVLVSTCQAQATDTPTTAPTAAPTVPVIVSGDPGACHRPLPPDGPASGGLDNDYNGEAVFEWRMLPEESDDPEASICDTVFTGTTDDGTDVLGIGGLEQVYIFNLATTVELTFDACNSDFDTILAIYPLNESMFEGGSPLVYRDDGGCEGGEGADEYDYENYGFNTRTRMSAVLSAGCYAFVIEGYSTEQGLYEVTVSCNTNVQTNTTRFEPIACGGQRTGDTSTYAIVPPMTTAAAIHAFNVTTDNEPISFSACDSSFDVVLKVFDASLSEELAYRDDGGCDSADPSQQHMPVLQVDYLLAGQYYLVVEGYLGATGVYDVTMECGDAAGITTTPPPGSADRGSISCGVSMSDNTLSGNDTLGSGSREVYYSFSLTNSTRVTFSACDADFDTYLRIFDGASGPPQDLEQQIAARDDGGCGSEVESTRTAITHELPPGQYYIVVEGYLQSQGNFRLNMTCHDLSQNGNWSTTVECESQVSGSITIPPNISSKTVSIGNIQLPSALGVEFDGCISSSGLSLELTLANGGSTPAIGGTENASLCNTNQSSPLVHGFYRYAEFQYPGVYNVSIHAAITPNATSSTELSYLLDISCSPIESPVTSALSCNTNVTNSTVGGTHYTGQSSPERHYSLHVPTAQAYTFSTCEGTDPDFDTFLHIYTEALSFELASRDDGGCPGNTLHTSLTYTLDPGNYSIVVEGFRNSSGSFTLSVTCGAPELYRGEYRGPVLCGETVAGSTEQGTVTTHTYTLNVTNTMALQPIDVVACNSQFDTVLTVTNGSWSVTDDDGGCSSDIGESYASAIFDQYLAPGMYNVTIDGYHQAGGAFYATGYYEIDVTCHTDAPTPAPTVPGATGAGGVSTTPSGGRGGSSSSSSTASVGPDAVSTTPGTGTTTADNAQPTAPPTNAVTASPVFAPTATPTATDGGVKNTASTGSGKDSGGAAVTAVVVVLIFAVLIGGFLYWRQSRKYGSTTFKKMQTNPTFSADRLLEDDYEDENEVDVFARKRRGRTPQLDENW